MSKNTKRSLPVLLHKSNIEHDSLTDGQKHALELIEDWMHTKKKRNNMILRIGALAGCGKGYLIKYLLQKYKFKQEECYVVAYTGQAVNMLRQNGIFAKTVHSTFMKAVEVPILDEYGKEYTKLGIPVTKTIFRPVKSIPPTVKLVICDEASFLPEYLQDMIIGYNVPLLEVGDPLQLPPVNGTQCFTMDNLDYFFTQIMRQAEGSEIIDLATKIRNYDRIDTTAYNREVRFLWAGDSEVKTFYRFFPFFKASDMIISTSNKVRTEITELYRRSIIKTSSPYPRQGEKMICRKNDWNLALGDFPLTNGTMGYVLDDVGKSEVDERTSTYYMNFQPSFVDDDFYDGLLCDGKFLRKEFGKEESKYDKLTPAKKFEYAHVITAWLSQGAQYNNTLFLDSFLWDAELHMRLRYTAVTRARNRLFYVLPYSDKYPHWTDLWKGGHRPK